MTTSWHLNLVAKFNFVSTSSTRWTYSCNICGKRYFWLMIPRTLKSRKKIRKKVDEFIYNIWNHRTSSVIGNEADPKQHSTLPRKAGKSTLLHGLELDTQASNGHAPHLICTVPWCPYSVSSSFVSFHQYGSTPHGLNTVSAPQRGQVTSKGQRRTSLPDLSYIKTNTAIKLPLREQIRSGFLSLTSKRLQGRSPRGSCPQLSSGAITWTGALFLCRISTTRWKPIGALFLV